MIQKTDNRPHTTVALLGPSERDTSRLLARLAEALARLPGARVHGRHQGPDGRLRCELPARTLELAPPRGGPRDSVFALMDTALGADIVIFIFTDAGYDEAELTRLIRLTRAFHGAPLLYLDAGARDEEALDRDELELRALFDAHELDGDALPCVRDSSRGAIETLVSRLLETPMRLPGSDQITVAHPIEREFSLAETCGLQVYLAQGSLRAGETYPLVRPHLVAELTITDIRFGAAATERAVAPRHLQLRARFPVDEDLREELAAYTLLDPETAAKRPWSQVFELALTFFEDAPPYPPPPPVHRERWHPTTELVLEFAGCRHVPVRIFGVDEGDAGEGRYAWRVLAETERPTILVRRTQFVCLSRDFEQVIAMGEILHARERPPRSFPVFTPTPARILDDDGVFDEMGDIDIEDLFPD